MDWLMRYQAYTDCPNRTIWFTNEFGGFEFRGQGAPAADPIISALKAEKMIRKGNEAFLVVITATQESERRLEDTPIAREFPDVFPDDPPGLPLTREVDFSIDVLPGTEPISKAPYRMTPTEMAELKKQLNELMEQGFIRPSISPWGALEIGFLGHVVSAQAFRSIRPRSSPSWSGSPRLLQWKSGASWD
ncbi:PREDICTED: uncharacterized protein LOC109116482 [Tarenaya hassleriana]|uniref:uncharacterized protein LOC109116482 n=1 Tax=Tarenaya hassleriana TaxID=28532 RepID=UPI0008FD4E65|nr:PREDICTED: uncharacterized protein LOC109116482 [Tarenaya hassleriana]